MQTVKFDECGKLSRKRFNRVGATIICSVVLCWPAGCGGRTVSPEDQRAAVEALVRAGGQVAGEGTHVNFRGSKVTDADLVHLKNLPNLELLNVQDTGITDEGVKHLSELQSLKQLSLKNTKVTDVGLAHLSGAKSLAELDLEGLPITDEGLDKLHTLKKLQKVYIDSKHTTADGQRRLRQANPRITILTPD